MNATLLIPALFLLASSPPEASGDITQARQQCSQGEPRACVRAAQLIFNAKGADAEVVDLFQRGCREGAPKAATALGSSSAPGRESGAT